MNRRQLAFLVLVNALVSLAIALAVVWAVEWRRPDPEELAALSPALAEQANSGASLGVQAAPLTDAANSTGERGEAAENDQASGQPETLPTATSAPPTPLTEQTTYVVRAGDFLSAIAERYELDPDDLIDINNITNPDSLFVGQQLTLPISASAVATADAQPPAPTATSPLQSEPATETPEADNAATSTGAFDSEN